MGDCNCNEVKIKIKKLSEMAVIPTQNSTEDAGFDLYAAEDCLIPYGNTVKVPTDIATEFSPDYVALVYARSGLATKRGLRPANCVGVIDASYRGNWYIPLHNDSNEPQEIHKGDRIAQVIFHKIPNVTFEEVEELRSSDRGNGGFGSSGI